MATTTPTKRTASKPEAAQILVRSSILRSSEAHFPFRTTEERLELRPDSKCVKLTIQSVTHNQYDRDHTYEMLTGRYELALELDGNTHPHTHTHTHTHTLVWAKKWANSRGEYNGGAAGTPSKAWDVEGLAGTRCDEETLTSDAGWTMVELEGGATTIVDESSGYDGGFSLGKTLVLGTRVPCRGPASLHSTFRV